ncbi:MAG: EVE domain-containing protein [Bdellovibrionota bacterium]
MAYWLVKSEPDVYSIDDLARDKTTAWDCVRNYQARNYLKEMAVKDSVLFYHSSTEPSGVVGLAQVVKLATADATQFDPKSDYYDPKATKAEPRWFAPELKHIQTFKEIVTLTELKKETALKGMVLLQRGSRLSVQPVTEKEFSKIIALAQ